MLQTAACRGQLADKSSEGLDLVGLWDGSSTLAEQPREESARPVGGAAHAVSRHAGLPRQVSSPFQRSEEQQQARRSSEQEVGAPGPRPNPEALLMLGLEQVYCVLSWPKLRGKLGKQAG